ncbi:MAG: type III secretion system chaperone [Pseudomonadota bacterium]
MMKSFCIAGLLLLVQNLAWADSSTDNESMDPKMDNQRLQGLIEHIAGNIEGSPGFWQFDMDGFKTSVITDEEADRMRIIVPVATLEGIDSDRLYRIMQANFDSALDARYSIAKGVLWSAYIHPLSILSDHQFVDALAQTVNLAATYGTTYSSGALIFSQGDSQGEQNKHYQEIIERENSI